MEKGVRTVLLLNMSTLPDGKYAPSMNHYYKISSGGNYVFEGIGQLEAGTKFVLARALRHEVIIDRIVVTGSPETFAPNSHVNMSSMDFYIQRIMGFIRGGAEGETVDGDAIIGDIQEKLNDVTKKDLHNRESAQRICEQPVINDSEFMAKLVDAYKDKTEDFIKVINMEGVETSDAGKIKELSDVIMDNAEQVNVYMDIQGGDRAFTYVLNALMALNGDKKITVQRAISTKFSTSNIASEITNSTNSFKLVELITAMKAFTNYGRGDLLVRYFDELGYGEDSETATFVGIIKGISDAIQINDPAALTAAIKRMRDFIGSQKTFEDPYLNLVKGDIIDDYGDMIRERKENDSFDEALYNLDVIDWCMRKGFTQQGLTLIEDKMADFFMNSNVFDLTIDIEGGDRAKDPESWVKAFKDAINPQDYITNPNTMLFYTGFNNCIRKILEDYMERILRAACLNVVDKLNPEPLSTFLGPGSSRERKNRFCIELMNGLSKGERYEILSEIDIADLASEMLMWVENIQPEPPLSKGARAITTTLIRNKYSDADNSYTHEELYRIIAGRFSLSEKESSDGSMTIGRFAEILSEYFSQKTLPDCFKDRDKLKKKSETLLGAYKQAFLDNDDATFISFAVRAYLLEKGLVERVRELKGEQYVNECLNRIKADELYNITRILGTNNQNKAADIKKARKRLNRMIKTYKPHSQNVFGYADAVERLFDIWLADEPDIKRQIDDAVSKYNPTNNNVKTIRDELNEMEFSVHGNQMVEEYILFRDLEKKIEDGKTRLSAIERFETLCLLIPKVPGYQMTAGQKAYRTWAGISQGDTFDISNKSNKTCVVHGQLNPKLQQFRDDIDLILRLHEALKQERNNSNHASERGLRLDLRIVEQMMRAYVDMCRKYIVEPLGY